MATAVVAVYFLKVSHLVVILDCWQMKTNDVICGSRRILVLTAQDVVGISYLMGFADEAFGSAIRFRAKIHAHAVTLRNFRFCFDSMVSVRFS